MPAKPPPAKTPSPMSTSDWLRFLRDLAELMETTALTEIELEDEAKSVRLSTNAAPQASYAPTPLAPASPPPAASKSATRDASGGGDSGADSADLKNAIRSPMVGTVYLAPEPGAANFVSEGDQVKSGQTLLIIEAMKVMNPITAPKAGVVKKVLVENAQPVEFDQPLITLD